MNTESQSEAVVSSRQVKKSGRGRSQKGSGILPMARSKMPEYTNWTMMMHRCYNPKRKDYKWYGGRGITVCERWRLGDGTMDGFECFFVDMGCRPPGEDTVDRKDGEGHYCKDNCIWSHIAPQQRHKSSTVYIEFRGEKLCRAEMARKYNIPHSALRERMELLGWSIEEALLTPSIPTRKVGLIEFQGESLSVKDWASRVGLRYFTLLARINAGWTMEKALHTPLSK